MTVTISTQSVGMHFAQVGIVKAGSKTLHMTRLVPRGFTEAALAAAESWARENGHTVKTSVNR